MIDASGKLALNALLVEAALVNLREGLNNMTKRSQNNLIVVPPDYSVDKSCNRKSLNSANAAKFLLCNVMSLAPKIDEIRDNVLRKNFQFACFVET